MMTTTTTNNGLVKLEERLPLSRPEDVETLRSTIAKGATDSEMGLFVQVCQRLRLDPFARQIYLVKRPGQAASIQVSIDGFRVVAERSGQYEGQTKPEWCDEDGVWRDVWLSGKAPAAARVGVYRTGFREPLVRVARTEAYRQRGPFWDRMADHMIAKVAEALALRAAFPHDLGGVYAPEEMGNMQASEHDEETPRARVVELGEAPEAKQRSSAKLRRDKPEPATVIEVQALPKATMEQATPVLEKVREVFPNAVVAVDADEQITKAKVDPRSKRGVLLRSAAQAGATLEDVERWLGHGFASITPDEVDALAMDLATVKAGKDTFLGLINARWKE